MNRPIQYAHIAKMRDIDTIELDGRTYTGAELRIALTSAPAAPTQSAKEGEAVAPEGWRLIKLATPEERSWPEDREHENGHYYNACRICQRDFIGHKRRVTCKVCDTNTAPQQSAPTQSDAAPGAAVDARGQEVVTLLRKYKKLCIEIGQGDSLHLGRIDRAITEAAREEAPASPQQIDAAPACVVVSTRPMCRDCADFGPICPYSGKPCGSAASRSTREQP